MGARREGHENHPKGHLVRIRTNHDRLLLLEILSSHLNAFISLRWEILQEKNMLEGHTLETEIAARKQAISYEQQFELLLLNLPI